MFRRLTIAGLALALLLGSFLFLAWSAFSLPTTFSVVATSLAANRHTMGIGLQSMVRRVPMMIGPLIGGALVTRFGWSEGVRYALLGCIGLGILTAVFQWFMSEGVELVTSDSAASVNENRQRLRQSGEGKGTLRTGFIDVVRSFSPALRELRRFRYFRIMNWSATSSAAASKVSSS